MKEIHENTLSLIDDYRKERKTEEYEEYKFRKVCIAIADSLSRWEASAFVKKSDRDTERQYDYVYNMLYVLLKDLLSTQNKIGKMEADMVRQCIYVGKIYRYIESNAQTVTIDTNHNTGLFVAWMKERQEQKVTDLLWTPVIEIEGETTRNFFGIDLTGFQKLFDDYAIKADLSTSTKQIVFPMLKSYTKNTRNI